MLTRARDSQETLRCCVYTKLTAVVAQGARTYVTSQVIRDKNNVNIRDVILSLLS